MIYLDNAANTPVFPEVLEAMLPWFQPDHVGNASSVHTNGVNAMQAIKESRKKVAEMLNAEPSEIYFTSGGTESNNTWLRCLGETPIVAATVVEHDSVLESWNNNDYIFQIEIPVLANGAVDLDRLETLLRLHRGNIDSVSVVWVNNELGTVNPIEKVGTLCKKYHAKFHTDAVQAAGHVPIDVKKCHVDFLSLSGHKFGAPPGVGALFVRNGIKKQALIYGGGQENGMRGGTYNVPGIVGLGKAAEIVMQRLPSQIEKWRSQEQVFCDVLKESMPCEYILNSAENRTHNIISLTIPGVNSEAMLFLLDQRGIYISAGSACSAASSRVSHVLKGIGMSDEEAASTVRISFGYENTDDEIKSAALAIADVVRRLKGAEYGV